MKRIYTISAIHCGVVGNIQAFHVCAPGSIPGDGTFYIFEEEEREERKIFLKKERKKMNEIKMNE